jgi:hypothetical protein
MPSGIKPVTAKILHKDEGGMYPGSEAAGIVMTA